MSNAAATGTGPNPFAIMDMLSAYQRSAALKAGVDLEIFTHIARGSRTAAAIATAARASERGVRILCDSLVLLGLLTKDASEYGLAPDSSAFLSKDSPAYLGGVTGFLLAPHLQEGFLKLTEAVRKGGTAMQDGGNVTPDNEVWVDFANSMTALMRPAAQEMASILAGEGERSILDIAAGHGIFGIALAQANPSARVTALDWKAVLQVASQNAEREGVSGRYDTVAGDAFTTDLGGPHDVVLLTNFLHHFDPPTCVAFLRRVREALNPGGVCATLEFVPNDDRVSPPQSAWFPLVMLASTPSGDAYTFAEFNEMFRSAGFLRNEAKSLQASPETLILSYA